MALGICSRSEMTRSPWPQSAKCIGGGLAEHRQCMRLNTWMHILLNRKILNCILILIMMMISSNNLSNAFCNEPADALSGIVGGQSFGDGI